MKFVGKRVEGEISPAEGMLIAAPEIVDGELSIVALEKGQIARIFILDVLFCFAAATRRKRLPNCSPPKVYTLYERFEIYMQM